MNEKQRLQSVLSGIVPDRDTLFSDASRSRIFPGPDILAGAGMSSRLHTLIGTRRIDWFVDSAVVNHPTVSGILSGMSAKDHVKIVSGQPQLDDIGRYCDENPRIADAVVSIGGGSTHDFAKAAIVFRADRGLRRSPTGRVFGSLGPEILQDLPVLIALPTTAGSGAEQSRYFVAYDRHSEQKVFGRSWALVADLVIVDPDLMQGTPLNVLLPSAFDAFVHALEVLLSRPEATVWSDSLASGFIPGIMSAVDRITGGFDAPAVWQELAIISSVCGNLISNTRTGLIHEMAGPLTEHLQIPHGLALLIVAPAALATLEEQWPNEIERICIRPEAAIYGRSPIEWVEWWQGKFDAAGVMSKVASVDRNNMGRDLRNMLEKSMYERIAGDKVLCEKIHPVSLDSKAILRAVHQVLDDQAGVIASWM